jgi:hypothetical protein
MLEGIEGWPIDVGARGWRITRPPLPPLPPALPKSCHAGKAKRTRRKGRALEHQTQRKQAP